MSNRTRKRSDVNLRRILDKLNAIEYYTCPGEKPGTAFLACSFEIFPYEVSMLKYLIRREMLDRKQGQLVSSVTTLRSQTDSLRVLLHSLREARVNRDPYVLFDRTERPLQGTERVI